MGRFNDLPKDVMWLIIGPVFAQELHYAYYAKYSSYLSTITVRILTQYEYPAPPNR